MNVPDELLTAARLTLALRRLWAMSPDVSLTMESLHRSVYKATIVTRHEGAATAHATTAERALERALVHLGISTDLTGYP